MVNAALVYILAPRLFPIIKSICTLWCTVSAGGAKAVFFIVWHWCKVHLSGAEPVSSWCSLHARRTALPPPPAPMSPERNSNSNIAESLSWGTNWRDWFDKTSKHKVNTFIFKEKRHNHNQCVLKQACSRMAFSFWTMVSLMTQSDRENSDGEST